METSGYELVIAKGRDRSKRSRSVQQPGPRKHQGNWEFLKEIKEMEQETQRT